MGSFAAGAGTQFLVTSTYSGPFTISAGTATANTPALNVTQTWNAGGTTFTLIDLYVTNSASAGASRAIRLGSSTGGNNCFTVTADGSMFCTGGTSNGTFSVAGNVDINASTSLTWNGGDLVLRRDAANTLAQRNGTNAQTFRVYNTFTDASNYQRLAIASDSIYTENGGTGAAQSLSLGGTATGSRLILNPNGSIFIYGASVLNIWNFSTAGHFLAATDNTYDIGASGATRPRTVFAGTSVVAPYVRTSTAYTVATLPAAGTAGAGARAYVTDATVTTFASTVAGGGANIVPVMSNGTNWIIG